MAQSVHGAPTVTANVAGSRQQVNLRDYLNKHIAPFLKKALTESLDAEVQFPLQWLGEHLIQQSILYEGNPDSTNIQERFVYKHDIPAPAAPSTSPPSHAELTSTEAVPSVSVSSTPQPPPTEQSEPTMNGTAVEEKEDDGQLKASEINGSPSLSAEKPQEEMSQDVEMGNAA